MNSLLKQYFVYPKLVEFPNNFLIAFNYIIVFIGRSNNSYSSGRNGHSHGGKSARSRRYAAGEGDRYERGTHPYNIPSSGSVSSGTGSVHSSKHQFVDENSSVDR